ncbi:MAG: hypothetical protein V3V67_08835 [Myxococcota bacterium]
MTKLWVTLLGLSAVLAVGCASKWSIDQLSDDELCVHYFLKEDDPRSALKGLREEARRSYDPRAREAAAAEIRRRELISSGHWELAESGLVRPGMSRCAVLAAVGPPSRSNPEDDMWIYHRPGYSSFYVAFEAGSVANAWSN